MKTSVAILFVLCGALCAQAQEPTQQDSSRPPTVAGKEQPKGEVDLAVEEFKKRGESVLTVCPSKCKESKDAIEGGVLNGRAKKLAVPPYPAIARSAHASGEVQVLVLIDKEGTVKAAQIVSGNPLLGAVSLKAARDSRFSPPLLEGKPQNIVGIILYRFMAQ